MLEPLAGWSPKQPEVDDISVHFGILTAQVPQGLGSQACLSGPFRGIGWSACPATSVGACKSWVCLNRHFCTFETLCTPHHKTQTSNQNVSQTIRFCNDWEGIQTLGFQDIPKMPLSQAYGVCVTKCVLIGISVHLNLCVPHPVKHRKVPKTTGGA